MKILIIDDENFVVKSLTRFLQYQGFEVYFALNGGEGLKIFSEINPDWVLLDQKMPGLSGMEVLIKIIAKKSDAKVCFWSGTNEADLKAKAIACGAKYFLEKPINTEELLSIVKGK
jgi:DNA-binding response OmpR family regulator